MYVSKSPALKKVEQVFFRLSIRPSRCARPFPPGTANENTA